MRMNKLFLVFTLSLLFSVTQAFGQDSTVIVLGNTGVVNQLGAWTFNPDPSNATPITFTNAQAKIGYGSLYVQPIGATAAAKFIGENYVRTAIANVNGISFDFLMGAGATNPHQFYMNVYTVFGSSSPTKYYDCRYDVVATSGSGVNWTKVSFDPTLPYPVDTRGSSPYTCPASPSGMDALSAGSQIRAIALNLGDTSASDVGYDGYFDKVIVDRDSGKTTYDLEPYLVATNKDQCKNGGWANYRRADGSTFTNQGDCIQFVNTGN